MTVGVVRWLQGIATLVVAGPLAMVGVIMLLDGDPVGAAFVVLAVAIVALSEYLYLRLRRGTVGRLRRLVPWR